MSYATGHNSFTSHYLLNIYIYCIFWRFCIINCENKKSPCLSRLMLQKPLTRLYSVMHFIFSVRLLTCVGCVPAPDEAICQFCGTVPWTRKVSNLFTNINSKSWLWYGVVQTRINGVTTIGHYSAVHRWHNAADRKRRLHLLPDGRRYHVTYEAASPFAG
jgi:hypothetical protein